MSATPNALRDRSRVDLDAAFADGVVRRPVKRRVIDAARRSSAERHWIATEEVTA